MDEPNRKRLYPLNQLHDSDSFPDQIEITNQMAPLMSITPGGSSLDQNFIDSYNTHYLNRKKAKRTDYLKDDTYNWCLKENSITSEKRIGHLLNALKEQVAIDHVTKEEFFEASLQYVAKLIEDKKWTGLSTEKAISLALLANYTPKSNKVDLFSCKYCALSYPPGKHECETCEMTFSVEMFLFAHQVTEHGYVSSADETIVCPFCGHEFQNDPILLANHLHDYHLCRFNHIECPEGCSELIVENNPKSLQDHLFTKHQCQICGDRILIGEYDFHMKMFHSEPRGTTGQTELNSASNFTSWEVVQCEQADVDGIKLANQDLQTSNLNSAKIAPRERIQVGKDSQKGDQFDMSSIELHDVTAPEWKVCTTCKMAMKVELLALCMFCENDSDPFVSMDELILHIWRVHEKKPSITHIVCSFCESTFQNVKGFLVHRELSHDYCHRHYLCGASCNCLLLSDSLEKAAKHIESRDTICHLRYPFTSLKNQKHCFQCKTSVEISYVYYCMFCKMSGFISITELLSHLMKKHRCKVYGQFDCNKCEKSFHDPNRLIHHFKLQHGGCKSHRMCSRTEDCDYVFPSEVPPIIHNCHQDQCYINPTVSQLEQCVDSIHQEMRDDQIAPPSLIRSTTISAPPFLLTKFPQPLAGSSNWCTGLTPPPNFNPDDLVFTEPSYRAQSSNFNPLQSRDISSFYPRSGPPNVQCVNEQPSININVSAVIQEREQLVSYRSGYQSSLIGPGLREIVPLIQDDRAERSPRNQFLEGTRHAQTNRYHESTRNWFKVAKKDKYSQTVGLSMPVISTENQISKRNALVQTDKQERIPPRVCADKDIYKAAFNLYGTVRVCLVCNVYHKDAPDIRSKCGLCPNMWFLYRYELDAHYETQHKIESKNDATLYNCMFCDKNQSFQTQSAQKLVMHVELVHKRFPHLICVNADCTILNHRVPHQHQSGDKSTLCRQVLNTYDFDWFAHTEGGTRVESLRFYTYDVKYRAQCNKCDFEYSVKIDTPTKQRMNDRCRQCEKDKLQRVFIHTFEKVMHMKNKHEVPPPKNFLEEKFACKVCNDSERYFLADMIAHRKSVHGFCSGEHLICVVNGCFYVTSDLEEYDMHLANVHQPNNN